MTWLCYQLSVRLPALMWVKYHMSWLGQGGVFCACTDKGVTSSVDEVVEDIPLFTVSQGEGLSAILCWLVRHVLLWAKPP